MKKEHVLARLKEDCLVAVIRAKNYEQGEKVVDAIIEGGINFIELTMTMDDGDPVVASSRRWLTSIKTMTRS